MVSIGRPNLPGATRARPSCRFEGLAGTCNALLSEAAGDSSNPQGPIQTRGVRLFGATVGIRGRRAERSPEAYPEVTFYPRDLRCHVCGLSLNGTDELDAAGILLDWLIPQGEVEPMDFVPDFEEL